MTAESAVSILSALEHARVTATLSGGWAVDALISKQTRAHADLDLWIPAEELHRLIDTAVAIGLDRLYPWGDERPWNFVLHDGDRLRVDLHLYEPLGDGSVHYGSVVKGMRFPAQALGQPGLIGDTPVVCEAPECALRWHTGYPIRAVDRHDVAKLCEHFGMAVPPEYK